MLPKQEKDASFPGNNNKLAYSSDFSGPPFFCLDGKKSRFAAFLAW